MELDQQHRTADAVPADREANHVTATSSEAFTRWTKSVVRPGSAPCLERPTVSGVITETGTSCYRIAHSRPEIEQAAVPWAGRRGCRSVHHSAAASFTDDAVGGLLGSQG
jgi:hypothetical protein